MNTPLWAPWRMEYVLAGARGKEPDGCFFCEHTNFMPVIADVRVMPEHLDQAWRRRYPAFADLPGARATMEPA